MRKNKNILVDTRLIGTTTEDVYLSVLNQQAIFATSFDTAGLDGIVFDNKKRLFKIGEPPFYVQIKCRGSKHKYFNPQGHSFNTISKIKANSQKLSIPLSSLYFVVGFFNNNDIRNLIFYTIPFKLLRFFKSTSEYRFSVKKCKEQMQKYKEIFEL